jgi:hypothetical protein
MSWGLQVRLSHGIIKLAKAPYFKSATVPAFHGCYKVSCIINGYYDDEEHICYRLGGGLSLKYFIGTLSAPKAQKVYLVVCRLRRRPCNSHVYLASNAECCLVFRVGVKRGHLSRTQVARV